MAQVKPFKGIRPKKEFASKVVSLPYDVMSRKEASKMAQGNPYSFLHICRSEIDLSEEEDPYTEEVYLKAKSNIDKFLEEGIFLEEEEKTYYIYRQIMNSNAQTGIVACVSIDDYMNNIIKKHELTRVEKEIDRINHFDYCNTNTEPVFLTYKDVNNVKKIINDYANNNEAEYDFITEDNVSHTFWKINGANIIFEIEKEFESIDSLYIADGHHRSASACKVGLKRREENPKYTGKEEFNYFMAVIFPDSDLRVFDYNRVVRDLNGLSKEDFIAKIKEIGFDVIKMEEKYNPEKKHTFSMYLDGSWYKLISKENIISDDIIESLDVSILQNNILGPILGIEDPRTDKRIDFVGGIRGLDGLEKRVNEDMAVAFAVYPVGIKDLITVSDNGLIMPPKSTWFEPKLGSGLFLHRL